MFKFLKPVAAGAAFLAMVGTADAARIASAPMIADSGSTRWFCAVVYYGAITTPIPVLVTAKLGDGSTYQQRITVRGVEMKRNGGIEGFCNDGEGFVCTPLSCVVNYSVPAADIRASLCVQRADQSTTCLELH